MQNLAKIGLQDFVSKFDDTQFRPESTISRTTTMLLTVGKIYEAILTTMGELVLAVTTTLNINFLCKLRSDLNLLGESTLLKVGKSLVVGQVIICSQGIKESLTHTTCTHYKPPKSMQKKDK